MATALNAVEKTILFPDVDKIEKIGVWKTSDGVYHETTESVRTSLTSKAMRDFVAMNNLSDISEITELLAQHMPNIIARIAAAY